MQLVIFNEILKIIKIIAFKNKNHQLKKKHF